MAKTKNPNLRGRSRPPGSSAIEQRHPFCCKPLGDKTPQRFTCPRAFADHVNSLSGAIVITLQPRNGTSRVVLTTDNLGWISQVAICKPTTSWKHGQPSKTFSGAGGLLEAISSRASGTFAIEGTKGRSIIELSRGVPTRVT